MTRVLLLFLCLTSAYLGRAQSIEITTDHPDGAYATGERVVFRIASERRGTLEYEISYTPDAGPLESGRLDYRGGVAEVTYTSPTACFLHLRVRLDGREARAGVVVGRDDLSALGEAPDDFDAFWARQRDQLDAVPPDVRAYFIEETDYTKTYEFSAAYGDGRRVYGHYVLPKTPGRKPIALYLPAFGDGANLGRARPHTAERGNLISVSITIHNAPPGRKDSRAYRPDNPRDPRTFYYRYAMLAAMRALDVAADLPEWDRESVLAYGESQGGGLALLLAGTDARVTHVFQSVAALGQHEGHALGRASGFPNYLQYAEEVFDDAGYAETRASVGYYDIAYAARRFRGQSMHFVNYLDEVCPPETHYAAFNEARGPRVALHSLDLEHGSPDEFQGMFLRFARLHLPATRTPPWPWPEREEAFLIDAGEDVTTRELSASLRARATSDGRAPAADWTVAWEQVSGPGHARFADGRRLDAEVSFSEPGEYRLRVRVRAPHPSDDRKYYLLVDEVTVLAGAPGVLPAELLHFGASAVPEPTLLSWATATESGVRHFAVERSSDGAAWATIGTVAAAGNSAERRDYDYLDPAPPQGRSYYRLVTVDEDGTRAVSEVATADVAAGGAFVAVPNPSDGLLSLRGARPGEELRVYDAVGRLVFRQRASGQRLDLSALGSGVYTLTAGARTTRVVLR